MSDLLLRFIFLCASCIALSYGTATSSSCAWGYKKTTDKELGPADWKIDYPACGGRHQSPISIPMRAMSVQLWDDDRPSLEYRGACEKFTLRKLEDLYKWEIHPDEHCTVKSANFHKREYTLLQFHMHGKSEHSVYLVFYTLPYYVMFTLGFSDKASCSSPTSRANMTPSDSDFPAICVVDTHSNMADVTGTDDSQSTTPARRFLESALPRKSKRTKQKLIHEKAVAISLPQRKENGALTCCYGIELRHAKQLGGRQRSRRRLRSEEGAQALPSNKTDEAVAICEV